MGISCAIKSVVDVLHLRGPGVRRRWRAPRLRRRRGSLAAASASVPGGQPSGWAEASSCCFSGSLDGSRGSPGEHVARDRPRRHAPAPVAQRIERRFPNLGLTRHTSADLANHDGACPNNRQALRTMTVCDGLVDGIFDGMTSAASPINQRRASCVPTASESCLETSPRMGPNRSVLSR